MATFGDITAGTSTFPTTNDRAIVGQFVLAENGQVTNITVFFDATSAAGDFFKGLIYADAAGLPGALVAVGAATSVPAGGGELVSSVTPFMLAAGTYWVGAVINSFNAVWDADTGAGGQRQEAVTYASPAGTFGTPAGSTAHRISAYVTYTPESELNQYLEPSSDVSAGTWTPSEGATLWGTIDEASAAEIDYNRTNDPAGGNFTVALQAGSDPYVSTGHIVRYVIAASTGSITVRLMQGAVEIANWVHNPAPLTQTTYAQTLSGGQADSITDYTNLRLTFEAAP